MVYDVARFPPQPKTPETGGPEMRAWSACLLLVLTTTARAAGPEAPPLAFEPAEGPPGSVITITGPDLGESQGSRSVALQRGVSEKKHVGLELQVIKWEAGRIEARIPDVKGMGGTKFLVVLMDRTGRVQASSRDRFRLTRNRPSTQPAGGAP